jgi:hypothetical protein
MMVSVFFGFLLLDFEKVAFIVSIARGNGIAHKIIFVYNTLLNRNRHRRVNKLWIHVVLRLFVLNNRSALIRR